MSRFVVLVRVALGFRLIRDVDERLERLQSRDVVTLLLRLCWRFGHISRNYFKGPYIRIDLYSCENFTANA